jgi:putative nucleotidyltransferase with HDIG domain
VTPQAPAHLLATIAAAAVVGVLVDLLLAPLPAVIRGRSSWADLFRVIAPVEISALPVQIPLITALAYVYMHVSAWGLVLFVVPAFAAQRLYLLYRHQRETAEQLERANLELSSANLSFATALVATLDARDEYTAGHSAAVAIYARDIAARMGLNEADQRLAHLSGLVHDIGKVGLHAGLLEKTGPLTLEERRQMEQHPIIGERILKKVENYREIARIVRHHHERMDGTGYPDRLVDDDVPLISRIIAVADAYNAMTSDRPYRAAMPSQVARVRLAQSVGTQLDTNVVAAFEAILATATEGYRTATGTDFQAGVHDVRTALSTDGGSAEASYRGHGDGQFVKQVLVAHA